MTLTVGFDIFPADRMTGEVAYRGDDGLVRIALVELRPKPSAVE
jgi:hypothetical protein